MQKQRDQPSSPSSQHGALGLATRTIHLFNEAGMVTVLFLLQELRNPSGGAPGQSFCFQLRVFHRASPQPLGQAGGPST